MSSADLSSVLGVRSVTGHGAAGFAVYDDSVNMTVVAHGFSRFLAAESCGQCPPPKLDRAKQGSLSITERLAAILDGHGSDELLGGLAALLRSVTDANRCLLGREERLVVSSILREFPEDVAAFLGHRAGSLREIHVPLIDDVTDDGTVEYKRWP